MKRLFFIFSIVLMVSSCFKDGPTTTRSYTLTATFEYTSDVYQKEFGADSIYFDVKGGTGFQFNDLVFYHNVDTLSAEFNGGLLMSYLDIPKSEVTEGLENQYRVHSIKGLDKNTFLVFHQEEDPSLMPKNEMEFIWDQYGTCVMAACFVNNTVEVVDSLRANFELGDRLVLKATGWLGGQKTGEAEINLADFSATKDSIVTKWTVFDLSKLGSVKYVDFSLYSSKENIPLNVCLDNITASIDLAY